MKRPVIFVINSIILLVLAILFFRAAYVGPSDTIETYEKNPYKVDSREPKEIEGMELVWNDEFNVDGKPNPENWGYEYGFVRNRELQWYQPQNAYCKDGRLIIEGKKERVDNPNYNPLGGDWRSNSPYADYTSSCLITKGFHQWTSYGYFEIRARFEPTKGSWPAIWMLGSEGNWPHCGEIDIMEFYRIDEKPFVLANVAWGSGNYNHGEWNSVKKPLADFLAIDPDWASKYHVWSMKWDKNAIQLYVDDILMNNTLLDATVNPDGINPFSEDKKHYLLINLALGSNGGDPNGTDFPIVFEIDYVRVYKPKDM